MAHFLEIAAIIGVLYLATSAFKIWPLRSRFNKAARFDFFRILDRETKRGKRPKVFVDLHRKYGETFEFKALSVSRRLSTCSPKNIQTIATTNFEDWGVEPFRGDFPQPFIGQGVFTHDGEIWKRAREIIRPTFNRAEIADLESFEVHVGRLLALIPRDGRIVDLQPLFKRLFLDTSTEFIFGQSVESLLPDTPFDAAEFMAAFDASTMGVLRRMSAGPFRPLFYFDKTWEKAYTKVHKFIDKNVQTALQHQNILAQTEKHQNNSETKEKYILLRQMAQETRDPYALRNQVLNVFLPARDTSRVAISNVMFELARHPASWESLRAEVQGIGDQPLTFELVKSLKVAKSIINETLRLHAPASMVTRVALRDTILPVGGGPDQLSPLFIAKGTAVISNLYAVHMNPEIWGDDVEEFKPERWGQGRPLWEAKWQYEPFWGGPRMCPAKQMVLTQVTYLLVRLAQEFKGLENRDEVYEFLGAIKMGLQSRNGAKVSLKPA